MINTARRVMFCGPTGSGKTARMLDTYHTLLGEGIPSDFIQVLVLNRRQAAWFKDQVKMNRSGALQVNTYFSFIQRELRRFWHVAEAGLDEGQPVLEPVFLTMETAQYLMELCIGEMRSQGRFSAENFRSQPARMALQLTETMQIAAVSCLDAREIAERLQKAWEGKGEAPAVYDDVRATLELYRRRCFAGRMLDYALSLELYNGVLLKNEDYQQWLQHKIRHLLVDDTEEILPAAFKFIMKVLPHVESATFAYCTDGGHSVFFGAHPELVTKELMPRCTVEKLTPSYTSSPDCGAWGASLAARVKGHRAPMVPRRVVMHHVVEDLRGTMIERVGDHLLQLLAKGVAPNEIAVVAPFVDKVLEHQLSSLLGLHGYAIAHVSGSKRLLDLPFAGTLLTLLQLTHPQWRLYPTTGDIAQALNVLLDLDPVRSMLLAAYAQGEDWRALTDTNVCARIGYAAVQGYDFLRRHLAALREPASLAEIVQKIFTELLYPLNPSPSNLQGCRYLTEAARHFQVFSAAAALGEDSGWHFMQMIQRGTIAADRLAAPALEGGAVVLTTAYSLLMDKGNTFAYQYWLDISRDAWYRSDAKELTNPHVLSLRWQEGQVWTNFLNEELRREKAARTVLGLAHRCRTAIIAAESACDSYGSEREGELAALIAEMSGQRGKQDD